MLVFRPIKAKSSGTENAMKFRRFGWLITLGLSALAHSAAAQGLGGGKTIRLVVPGPPGGPGGVIAHLLTTKASIHLNQTTIVEYKPGAGGNIAIEYVARSPADGTTLFFGVPAVVTNPYFQKHSGRAKPASASRRSSVASG